MQSGNNGLHRAAAYGQVGAVVALLTMGMPVDAANGEGATALIRAARWGHDAVVKLLLEHDADPHAEDRFGKTALDWAIEKGHEDVAAALSIEIQRRGPVPSPELEADGSTHDLIGVVEDDGEEMEESEGYEECEEEEAHGAYQLGEPIHVEGWMAKQGHFIRNWKNRWFVLEGRVITYYAKEGAKASKGVINMVAGTDVIIEEKYSKPFCFTVITPAKRFVLQAADEDEMAEWIEAIQNNLECVSSDSVVGGGGGDDDD